MKNILSMEEFSKELVKIGYTSENSLIETKNTFYHSNKEYKSPFMIAFKLHWDWCQGFKLKDNNIWAIAKVKTVPIKLLKTLEDTKQYCVNFSKERNHNENEFKRFLKEMTQAYYTKEKPYQLYVYGCDDTSYSQSFSTLNEIKKLIKSWEINPPDSPWNGAIFTN